MIGLVPATTKPGDSPYQAYILRNVNFVDDKDLDMVVLEAFRDYYGPDRRLFQDFPISLIVHVLFVGECWIRDPSKRDWAAAPEGFSRIFIIH